MLQAPKGGAICSLNNEWYEGGQFLPELGLPKGSSRKVKTVAADKTADTQSIAEMTVYRNVLQVRDGKTHGVSYRMAGCSRTRYTKFDGTLSECSEFVRQVLAEKNKTQNHPTLVTVEN